VISAELEGLLMSNLVHNWGMKNHITDKRHDIQGQKVNRKVTWWSDKSISQEQKVPEISKLVGRLPTLPAITRTSFKVKSQHNALYAVRGLQFS